VRDLALLVAELAFYFAVLATLFGLRKRLGMGLFVTALGTMHFLETYLAASLYVPLPGGFVVSPGSSVLFSGKLVMLLLVYIKEDARAVREPIYGLLVGNFLMVGLVLLLRQHHVLSTPDTADLGFLNAMGWLMVWGTLLLFVDSIAIVLLYERLGRWLRRRPTLRIWICAAAILSFDQLGFFAVLRLVIGVPYDVLASGWIGKMGSGLLFAALTGLYLRVFERAPERDRLHLRDVFETLTYRERYHALLEQAGRDALTGSLDRTRLETQGRQSVDLALAAGQAVTLILADVDRFKQINDRCGHAAGDEVLRRLAATLREQLHPADYLFRYGGDEFLIVAFGLSPRAADELADRLAMAIRLIIVADLNRPLGVSCGVATGPQEGTRFEALFKLADERLYVHKRRACPAARVPEEVIISAAGARSDRSAAA
jgi:diguanylate cyclase (GGDEF)-like protein